MRPRGKNKLNPHKNSPKRTPAQMDMDLVLIERLSLEGYTTREIAKELSSQRPYSLSHMQVHTDLKGLQEQWREEAKAAIDDRVAKMLKRLDKRRKELEKAWRRSQRMFESRTTRNTFEGTYTEWKREERDGQVAFQNALSDLDRQERELLGLDKPKKTALTDIDGKESFQPLVINIDTANLPRARKDNKE